MRKEKKKKEFVFNPADYDYMDNMPLDGWVWEFIRRNKEYKKQIDNKNKKYTDKGQYAKFFVALDNHMDNFYKSVSIGPYFSEDYNEKWFKEKKFIYGQVSKTNPIKIMNLKYMDTTKKEYSNSLEEPYLFLLKHCVESDQVGHVKNKENFIMALIDISAPKSLDEILKDLKLQLADWRKALKLPKVKDAKKAKKNKNLLIKNSKIWKSYLIVYDLVEKVSSYEKISKILSKYDDFYSEIKNIERHYKSAVKMINSDYKKYL